MNNLYPTGRSNCKDKCNCVTGSTISTEPVIVNSYVGPNGPIVGKSTMFNSEYFYDVMDNIRWVTAPILVGIIIRRLVK